MVSSKTARALLGDDTPISDSELATQIRGLTALAYGLLDLTEVVLSENQSPEEDGVDVESKEDVRKTHAE